MIYSSGSFFGFTLYFKYVLSLIAVWLMCVYVVCLSTCLKADIPEAGVDTVKQVPFVCPYEQYKRMKPFIQSQEEEAASVSTETVGMNGLRKDNDGDDEQKQEVSPEQDHFKKTVFNS
jgi:hypothetical protein